MPYQFQVLGTIISSVLNYDQLCKFMGEAQGVNNTKSTYVPCDGRSIVGSALNTLTKLSTAPDLRGKFIRGLNQLYSVGEPPFDATAGDTEPGRKVISYQADKFKDHHHEVYEGGLDTVQYSSSGAKVQNFQIGSSIRKTTDTTEKSTETRPKNIAVYYYIRIN